MACAVFTGLVEAVGHIQARNESNHGQRLLIKSDLAAWVLGESVAVNGVCLTVSEVQPGGFYAHASAETLSRSSLGRLAIGSEVNLERALRVGDRLGGHWVSGHVDAVIQLLSAVHVGESLRLIFELPEHLARFVSEKGSVAIEGVSLTVNEVERDRFSIMLIPHTQQATTLERARPGDGLNFEVDLIARYVVHALANSSASSRNEDRDVSFARSLFQAGFIDDPK